MFAKTVNTTNNHIRNLDLALVAGFALTAMLLALVGVENGLVRFIFGLPLVVILPGYALVAAFAGPTLGAAERIVLIIGLSVTTVAIGGLALNLTTWGLQPGSWAVVLTLVTFIGCGIALYRRLNGQIAARPVSFNPGFNWKQGAMLAVAGIMVVTALIISRGGVENQYSNFTQFWMIPDETGQPNVKLGIISTEEQTVTYNLRLEDASGHLVKEWPNIQLEPGKRWEITETIPVGPSLQAKLYRADKPNEVYRWANFKR